RWQRARGRIAGNDRRLPRYQHAITFELHHLEVWLPRQSVVTSSILQHQETSAVVIGFNQAFARDHDTGASILDRIDKHIAHPALVFGNAFDKEHAIG